MATFSILDGMSIERLKKRLKSKEALVEIELARAVNKGARQVVNLSIAEWQAFSTNPDYIKDRLYISSGAKVGRYQAIVQARTRATRADRFAYSTKRGKGVHLNVRRGKSGGLLKHAFVIKAKSNNRPLIIERLEKYKKGEGRGFGGKRFKAVYGPSINQHFHDSRERVAPQAMSDAKSQFLKAIGA